MSAHGKSKEEGQWEQLGNLLALLKIGQREQRPEPEYPKHIERMLDVMLCLPRRSAWGLVLASVESKIGRAALQRIILQVSEIEKRIAPVKPKRQRKRKRQSAVNALKIIASIPPPTQSPGDQLPM
jgi:hypothetical protein